MKSIQFRKGLSATILIVFLSLAHSLSFGQNNHQPSNTYENFGHTLNIGVGVGYFGYLDQSVPFVFLNYEFDVARNFTLAPFLGFASYQSNSNYYYGNDYYYYRETVVPVGVKGTYYFDKLLNLNRRWDIYAAASLGLVYHTVTWQDGYGGNKNLSRDASPLYLDGHVGAEYHCSRNIGLFLDLSTGVSTIGIAVHHL